MAEVDMIKWVWLESSYLVNVFHVVNEVICATPPILLGCHLNSLVHVVTT